MCLPPPAGCEIMKSWHHTSEEASQSSGRCSVGEGLGLHPSEPAFQPTIYIIFCERNTYFLLVFTQWFDTGCFFFFLMNNSNAMQFPPFSAEPFSLNFWVFCMEGLWKRRTCIPFPASLLSGWENCLTSLSFSFLICRTEITILFFLGLSLVIWWLRLCTSNARGPRGNPWSGT